MPLHGIVSTTVSFWKLLTTTMFEDNPLLPIIVSVYLTLIAAATVVVVVDNDDELELPQIHFLAKATGAFRQMQKRCREIDDEDDDAPQKKVKYDYERAYRCIQQDYLGLNLLSQFK